MNDSSNNTVRVNVFGGEYLLKSTEDPEHIRKLARIVDERMHRIAESGTVITTLKIAVLAAMDITDDWLRQAGQTTSQDDVSKRLEMIEELLDDSKIDFSSKNT